MKASLAFVGAICWSLSASAITIDTVPVGNPGNANDPGTRNEYGGVNYVYEIGKHEVTIGQYTAFLNAVAATDPYGLYNERMATDPNIAGIAQNSVAGSFSYSVIGSANRPVTYVGWGDAARFANWLHNGQPTGTQNESTTEDGAYRLLGATSSMALIGVSRNANAIWFLPSENEWYKAAYHQPAAQGGDSDNYWTYPMRTNNLPFSDQPPGATPANTRVGNFFKDDGVTNGYDDGYALSGTVDYGASRNYLTDVGAYASSPSFYGTFDQGGSVWEWNETEQVLLVRSFRGIRGSSWTNHSDPLRAIAWSTSVTSNEVGATGFRVATVAEPGASALGLVASMFLCAVRKRFSR